MNPGHRGPWPGWNAAYGDDRGRLGAGRRPAGHRRPRETGSQVHDLHRDVGAAELGYSSGVVEIVERLVHRPLARPLAAAVRAAKRLQSGRLEVHVAYMLIAALALVLVLNLRRTA